MRYAIPLIMTALCLAATGANCVGPGPDDTPRTPGLTGFASAEDLRSFLADQARSTVQNRGGTLPVFDNLGGIAPPAPAAPGDSSESTTAGGNGGFSNTNIQELGVDESDIVKNDGQMIYILDGSAVHIVSAVPAESMGEVAKVEVPDSGNSLYLSGTRLIVLSTRYAYYWLGGGGVGTGSATATSPPSATIAAEDDSVSSPPVGPTEPGSDGTFAPPPDQGPWGGEPRTTVSVFDVTDPAHPSLQATVHLQGDLVSSRMIDARLHVVVTSYPRLPDNPTPTAIEAMPLEEWLPNLEVKAGDGSVIASGDIAGWQDFFRPIDPDGYQITTIVTLDVNNPTAAPQSTAISANAGTIYASTGALYISDSDYSADGFNFHEDTMIHKLKFTAAGTDYVASGLVPGRPLNQYSLGEHDNYLRIATHVDEFSLNTSRQSNGVYVLGETAEGLGIVGRIEDIAPGEQIYSARFVGERGFLVTFRRIDPLFTLDLADPVNPKLAGELKVPGYSDHIQLLDENHLLTVGKDAQDAGDFAWVQGVQLSIFDVTDAANPTLLHKTVIGGRGTNSEANSNPKAFNYYAPLGALALPVDVYGGETSGPEYGQHEFTGLYVYNVTVAGGFKLLGRIASSEGVNQKGCYWGYYGFTRGVFIGDDVYSVTQTGVKAADLADMATLTGQTTFASAPAPQEDCFIDPIFVLPPGEGIR